MSEFGEYLTLQAVANLLQTTPNAVYLHIRKHGVPTKHAGRTTMVRLEDLRELRVKVGAVLPALKV